MPELRPPTDGLNGDNMDLNNELQNRWEKANKSIAEYRNRYEECLQEEANNVNANVSTQKKDIAIMIHYWEGYQVALKEVYNLTNPE